MKTLVLSFAVLLLMVSCGEEKEDAICDCIASTEKLNEKASGILKNGVTAQSEAELRVLKAEKKKKCVKFELMGGPEMKKRMETCKQ